MIEEFELENLLKKYGINSEKFFKNNSNVLTYGEYLEIENTLNYLINDLKIQPKNIEKCPSVLYFNVESIKPNYEFLKEKNVFFSNIETCLSILCVEPMELQKTYYYVLENYGIEAINRITSILTKSVERIKEIELKNSDFLNKKQILFATTSELSVEEIERIIKVCRENNIEITDVNPILETSIKNSFYN